MWKIKATPAFRAELEKATRAEFAAKSLDERITELMTMHPGKLRNKDDLAFWLSTLPSDKQAELTPILDERVAAYQTERNAEYAHIRAKIAANANASRAVAAMYKAQDEELAKRIRAEVEEDRKLHPFNYSVHSSTHAAGNAPTSGDAAGGAGAPAFEHNGGKRIKSRKVVKKSKKNSKKARKVIRKK